MCKTDTSTNAIQSKSFLQKHWYLFLLALIAILSFGLNFYAISKTGYGNAYYAAAIKSMTQSFHNFFYVSFDPAGMVSVDKPPLGLWIQAIFCLIFGYHGWAMLLPQALAATGSCIMMYILTAKHFGRPAGLISSLVFAVTPAVVVAARNNTIDMQLVLVLLIATWFLFKAIEKSKWRYLFLCALFVGLGFNIKMLQAYMILPAVAIIYLIFSKEKFVKRLLAGLISVGIMAVISFAWVFAVDLTPAANRPYVDSSTNNTVLELIIGHNGLERIYGQSAGGGNAGGGMQNGDGFGGQGGPGGQGMQAPGGSTNGSNNGGTPPAMPNQNGNNNATTTTGTTAATTNTSTSTTTTTATTTTATATGQSNQSTQTFGGGQGGPGGQGAPGGQGTNGMGKGQTGGQGGAVGNDIGTAGLLRLWNSGNYGQIAWLIVFTLFCVLVKLRKFDIKHLTLKQGVFTYWIIWLVTMIAFFSFAGFWHRYYLCMIAPAIAGLAGPGLVEMVKAFRDKRGWKQFLLPISLITTVAIETVYVWSYTALRAWLVPVMIVSAVIALILMAVHYVKPKRLALAAATGCMIISMLAAPFYWALTVVIYVPQNVTMPYAGPELASTASVPGMTANQETLTTGDSSTNALEKYLVAHYKAGSYLVVSQRANDVAQFIVDTGLPAVAYGGFLGSDNSLTLTKLKELVKEGKVTYFLISSGQGGNSNSDLITYVKENATLISASEYSGTSTQSSTTQSSSTSQSDGASTSNGISGSSLYLFK